MYPVASVFIEHIFMPQTRRREAVFMLVHLEVLLKGVTGVHQWPLMLLSDIICYPFSIPFLKWGTESRKVVH